MAEPNVCPRCGHPRPPGPHPVALLEGSRYIATEVLAGRPAGTRRPVDAAGWWEYLDGSLACAWAAALTLGFPLALRILPGRRVVVEPQAANG